MPSQMMFGQKLATITEPSFSFVFKMSECGPVHFFQRKQCVDCSQFKERRNNSGQVGCAVNGISGDDKLRIQAIIVTSLFFNS